MHERCLSKHFALLCTRRKTVKPESGSSRALASDVIPAQNRRLIPSAVNFNLDSTRSFDAKIKFTIYTRYNLISQTVNKRLGIASCWTTFTDHALRIVPRIAASISCTSEYPYIATIREKSRGNAKRIRKWNTRQAERRTPLLTARAGAMMHHRNYQA